MSTESQDDNQPKIEPVLKPFFPKATEILFYTGNTLASFKLVKKANSSITDEIMEYMSMMLQTFRVHANLKQYQEEKYVKITSMQDNVHPGTSNGISTGASVDHEQLTREDLKFSVKIFLRSLETEDLVHTINAVLTELKENYIESLMLSLPNYGSQLTLNELMPLWLVIEDFIDKQKILSAGVCDFMLPLLSELYNNSKHKPYANQINLGVCCSIPEELNKYVKENNIQLLTHSDPIDILNESVFQQTIREHCHELDAINWQPRSVVRYTSVIAHRGIIKTKGFFVYAKRELRVDP